MSAELESLAAGLLLPGLRRGWTPPDWLLRGSSEGSAASSSSAATSPTAASCAALTAPAAGARPDDVLIAIDEEGGDVTRLEAERGQLVPGQPRPRRVDDVELTRAGRGRDRRRARRRGSQPRTSPRSPTSTRTRATP